MEKGGRTIVKKFESREQAEGEGARVRRSIGHPALQSLDPFLLCDSFAAAEGDRAGFPDHPHRGFETVTYLLEGIIRHEDFAGHRGVISAGDLQWMTAGRGIVHCEMPGTDVGPVRGLQLWVNLKAKDKMIEPAYQELLDADIPRTEQDGVWVKVIAGKSMGLESPVRTRSPVYYLHFRVQPGKQFTQDIPEGWNAFVYVLSGRGKFGASEVESSAHHTLLLGGDGSFTFRTEDEECEFVLVAGEPTNEPVAHYGPFVMNTRDEVMQAFRDFNSNSNGFERNRHWMSEELKSRHRRGY